MQTPGWPGYQPSKDFGKAFLAATDVAIPRPIVWVSSDRETPILHSERFLDLDLTDGLRFLNAAWHVLDSSPFRAS